MAFSNVMPCVLQISSIFPWVNSGALSTWRIVSRSPVKFSAHERNSVR